MRVGAYQRVRVGDAVTGEHRAGQVLEVDLVHDAGVWRHDLEVVEGLLSPAQELVALPVAANSISALRTKASGVPKTSAMIEWSITSSAGASGLIFAGSPPSW